MDNYTPTSYSSASLVTLEDKERVLKRTKKTKRLSSVRASGLSSIFDKEKFSVTEKPQKKAVKEAKKKKRKKSKKSKEAKEGIPKLVKPADWKTWDKKRRQRWTKEQIEQWKLQQELEKVAWIAAAPERKRQKELVVKERTDKDTREQNLRIEALTENVTKFQNYWQLKLEHDIAVWKQNEWTKYIKCDGLPNPYITKDLATYLHLWEQEMVECDVEMYVRKLEEVLPVLESLDEFISKPSCFSESEVSNMAKMRVELREALFATLNACSYFVLRRVEERMTRESLKVARMQRIVPDATLCIWASIRLPIPQKPKLESGLPTAVDFPEINLNLVLPPKIDTYASAIRIAWLKYDHFSGTSRTYPVKNVPEHEVDSKTLVDYVAAEHEAVMHEQHKQSETVDGFYKTTKARLKELNKYMEDNKHKVGLNMDKEKEEFETLTAAEPPVFRLPREIVLDREDKEFAPILGRYKEELPEHEVDLRRYRIVGGVILLRIFKQPPQTKFMMDDMDISVLSLPKELEEMTYEVEYTPPPPPEPGVTRTPEEIEADLKRADEELAKLVLINMDLSDAVLWFEPPVTCQWDYNSSKWSTKHIHDVKYNEDKFTTAFRVGKLMPLAFGVYKYSNLPLQGWELKPLEQSNGVQLSVTGMLVSCEIQIVGDEISLTSLQNAPSSALQSFIGKRCTLTKFIKVMQNAGLDLFPEKDAYNMVENCYPKIWTLERHTYHCMASMCLAYNLQWSRWNAAAGRRGLILQLREYTNLNRLEEFYVCLATPLCVKILKCNELSQDFSDEPIESTKFYPDLLCLGKNYATVDARRILASDDFLFAETVFELLCRMRLLSFS